MGASNVAPVVTPAIIPPRSPPAVTHVAHLVSFGPDCIQLTLALAHVPQPSFLLCQLLVIAVRFAGNTGCFTGTAARRYAEAVQLRPPPPSAAFPAPAFAPDVTRPAIAFQAPPSAFSWGFGLTFHGSSSAHAAAPGPVRYWSGSGSVTADRRILTGPCIVQPFKLFAGLPDGGGQLLEPACATFKGRVSLSTAFRTTCRRRFYHSSLAPLRIIALCRHSSTSVSGITSVTDGGQ